MMTKRERNRHLAMYLRLLRFEAERFLARACCHNHAMQVWQGWAPVRDMIIPMIENGEAPENLDVTAVLQLTANIYHLAEEVPVDEPAIDGTLIDELAAKYGSSLNDMMHAYVRLPLLPPKKKARIKRQPKGEPIINVWFHKEGVL